MKLFKNSLPRLFFILLTQVVSPFGARTDDAALPEKVVLQLAWKHQLRFAGYYAALSKGFYQDAGRPAVTLKLRKGVATPFRPDSRPGNGLSSGRQY